MTSIFRDLYKGKNLADSYRKHRPGYPDWIHREIIDNHMKSPVAELELALDVGCGTGQVTRELAKYFKQVVGVDVSQDQLDNCPQELENVTFHLGEGEHMPFVLDGSVDMVTIATALHWLDIDRFFQEVNRVLKPGGSLIVLCLPKGFLDDEEANGYWQEIIKEKTSKYFTTGDIFCHNFYQGITLPYEGWSRKEFVIKEDWTLERFRGYLASFNDVVKYMQENPSEDFLGNVEKGLLQILSKKQDSLGQVTLKVVLKCVVFTGRKPTVQI